MTVTSRVEGAIQDTSQNRFRMIDAVNRLGNVAVRSMRLANKL
jgi:hypothetical protein